MGASEEQEFVGEVRDFRIPSRYHAIFPRKEDREREGVLFLGHLKRYIFPSSEKVVLI